MGKNVKYRLNTDNITGIYLYDIYNDYTLNIFCDGSYYKNKNFGAYSAIGVCKDTIIDISTKASYGNSSGYEEIKALRLGLFMANHLKDFKYINIFSDSKYAIDCVTNYIYNWRYDNNKESFITSSGQIAKYQDIIYETAMLLISVSKKKDICNVIFQPSHVTNKYKSILDACESFKIHNNINCKIDIDLIRYISNWNDYADKTAKSTVRTMWSKLMRVSKNERFCEDALYFMPKPIE